MSGMLLGNEKITDALEGAQSCQLLPSDGACSTLGFANLQAQIAESTRLQVQAPEAEGTHGAFNRATANAPAKPAAVEPQPAPAPDFVMQQQFNAGFKPA